MSFQFRFETLLRIRRQQEDIAKLAYAERLRERTSAIEVLRELEGLLCDCYDKRHHTNGYYENEQRIIYLSKEIQNQKNIIQNIQVEVEATLREYLGKKKQTDVISRLKEKDMHKFKRQQIKSENKNLDELYVTRFREGSS